MGKNHKEEVPSSRYKLFLEEHCKFDEENNDMNQKEENENDKKEDRDRVESNVNNTSSSIGIQEAPDCLTTDMGFHEGVNDDSCLVSTMSYGEIHIPSSNKKPKVTYFKLCRHSYQEHFVTRS